MNMTESVKNVRNSNLGYPRIGANREWKKALERFWSNQIDEDQLTQELKTIRLAHLAKQKEKGIELIPVGDFTLYDHMLDTAAMFGLVPERFEYEGGEVSLATYFAMARGSKQAPACEMTKWFNTNYHYIVPEIGEADPVLTVNRPLQAYLEAKRELQIEGKPVLIGPYTFVKLSKGYAASDFESVLNRFIPVYAVLLQQLEQAGAQWVQIDEPSLATSISRAEMKLVAGLYERLAQAAPGLNVMLQTYFDAVDLYSDLIGLPVRGIGLDFVHGGEENLKSLQEFGFPADKVLGAGVINGRNIWRSDLQDKLALLQTIAAIVPYDRLIVQPSCSLLHVPVSVRQEERLDEALRDALAFADEKLDELSVLKQAVNEGAESVTAALQSSRAALDRLAQSPWRKERQDLTARLAEQPSSRHLPFHERQAIQRDKWQLPPLPTTTIGSFPQTKEIRRARQLWRKGEWSAEQYDLFMKEQIREWIRLQEEIGLDVLVHGEFERTDMVEFFGEKLAGFAFTQNGWVQSYGSRCVKPPIIFGDVRFVRPMTVGETLFAQSLTNKPVKGMLTGPVTILQWSFVRDDISNREVAYQIALALGKEIKALEQAGIEMIQVDEPALREGLPLKKEHWDEYLTWAVESFRLATSNVKDTTQIHTHMCYCEFHDIIDAIKALDADVISIETSRSHGELVASFETNVYDKGIGLGVYDIHSPRVPAKEEMVRMIERALRVLPAGLFWINPDCGLKTRGIEETVASLKVMVEATAEIRSRLEQYA
ncbi:5-methyltetrahydropteroyltriglutamate--homocysteine S-methyltransferase [Paenibacillus sp. MSJ-34]|uniref:5-methyltetrahydropteroyltriglutamate-- homocysteine S-methyltransferase n=1 Tax=Paenibacillus sp. MSJ-34 TaxID=2841529 RepID=UPI002646D2F8|nr:5-methyltetrahydropteroyltriglutamate--homocysteine S-methyltransferase [Paenibacillus sp. MSJ-34]